MSGIRFAGGDHLPAEPHCLVMMEEMVGAARIELATPPV